MKALIVCCLCYLTAIASGATITWTNTVGSAVGDWYDADNWDLGRVPEDGDTVVLPGSDSSSSTTFCTSTLGERAPRTGKFKKVTVKRRHIINVSGWESKLATEDLTMESSGANQGGRFTCDSFTGETSSNRVWIAADTLTMNSNSKILACGFSTNRGPCWEDVETISGAAAHGGLASGGTAQTCGSVSEPTLPGSGASSSKSVSGGAIRIEAASIVMNGGYIQSDSTGSPGYNAHAAAPGSIYITCETISGSGKVSADGNGEDSTGSSQASGGGRIAVHYDAAKQKDITCTVSFSARGGISQRTMSAYGSTRYNAVGYAGTLYFTDDFFLKRTNINLAGKVFTGAPAQQVRRFAVNGDCTLSNSLLEFGDDAEVLVDGNLSLVASTDNGSRKNGIRITGTNALVSVGGDLLVRNAWLRLEKGGLITVASNLTQAVYVYNSISAPRNSGDIYLAPSPSATTNDAAASGQLFVGRTWTIGNPCVSYAACHPTNATSVKLSARRLVVDAGGQITADSLGYGAGQGPGTYKFGDGGKYFYYCGTAHAGRGCDHGGSIVTPEKTYGDAKNPLTPGTGSGNQCGGGVVWLEVSHVLTVNGTVSANGGNGTSGSNCGSAGGSVNLLCRRTLGGTGSITANGGNGEYGGYGSGGGGRVAIRYGVMAEGANLTATAAGGTHTKSGKTASAEDGTVYWQRIGGLNLILR